MRGRNTILVICFWILCCLFTEVECSVFAFGDNNLKPNRLSESHLSPDSNFHSNHPQPFYLGSLTPRQIFNYIKTKVDAEKIEKDIYGDNISIQPEHISFLNKRYGFFLSQEEVEDIFNHLEIKRGETLLEIGPGQTVFSIIAAIMGAKVTVVELSKDYLEHYKKVIEIFKEVIKENDGELQILAGDILDPKIKSSLSGQCFDHVICLDVISNEILPEDYKITVKNGIRESSKQEQLLNTLLDVINKEKGTLYIKTVPGWFTEYFPLLKKMDEKGIKILKKETTYAPIYPGEKKAQVFKMGIPKINDTLKEIPKTPSLESQPVIEKIIQWYQTGQGLIPGDCLLTIIPKSGRKLFSLQHQLADFSVFQPGELDQEKEMVFYAMDHPLDGLVLNCYFVEDFQKGDLDHPHVSFQFDPELKRVKKIKTSVIPKSNLKNIPSFPLHKVQNR